MNLLNPMPYSPQRFLPVARPFIPSPFQSAIKHQAKIREVTEVLSGVTACLGLGLFLISLFSGGRRH
jgi:hypothetical protein